MKSKSKLTWSQNHNEKQFSEMTANCSEKPKGNKGGTLGLLYHEKRMCGVISNWRTQVYQCLLIKNSILSFKAPASPRLLLFKVSASLRPLLDRQPRNTGGSLLLPFTNSTTSGLSNRDLGIAVRIAQSAGQVERITGWKENSTWAILTPKHNLSLDSVSHWEAARASDVFLHFLIWAGSEEAGNHVRKPGFSIFPGQFYGTKGVGRPSGASPSIVHLRRSDCNQLANQATNCSVSH